MLLRPLILVALLLGSPVWAHAAWSARDRLAYLGHCLKGCDKQHRKDGRSVHCTEFCRCRMTKDEATGMSAGAIENPTPAAQRTLDAVHRPCTERMRYMR